MTGREKVFVVCGTLLAGAFLAMYVASRPGFHQRYSVARVEAGLRANVQTGMERAEVEAYLDRAGFSHAFIAGNKAQGEIGGSEWALIRNNSRSLVSPGDIQVRFQFDENERLAEYSVKEISARDLERTNANVHRNH